MAAATLTSWGMEAATGEQPLGTACRPTWTRLPHTNCGPQTIAHSGSTSDTEGMLEQSPHLRTPEALSHMVTGSLIRDQQTWDINSSQHQKLVPITVDSPPAAPYRKHQRYLSKYGHPTRSAQRSAAPWWFNRLQHC
ncbi:Hypothetical predicted protein [Pelobates cultripes]|uniref:Uncharacterized protein n=1 Tax=Pelobates cultripes TaxID=61616 RepID=A0AAD1RXD3_PELCU|nr:Hypothetical predicted protein [Pelobates cultripes]